jgi:hypothetical protein
MRTRADKPKPEMNTDFCVNWQGDRKSKHCRTCAVKGTSCFMLWRAVQGFAEGGFVLVNKKPGGAFGHRYQLEPPKKNPMICYLQTLQDKHAHFGLPIEDFLYVTKTGLGGMYETPSQTKQEPFVGLILSQIGSCPEGAELIRMVRAIPRKTEH